LIVFLKSVTVPSIIEKHLTPPSSDDSLNKI